MCICTQGVDTLQLELHVVVSHIKCVLETELAPLWRRASAPNGSAFSPVLSLFCSCFKTPVRQYNCLCWESAREIGHVLLGSLVNSKHLWMLCLLWLLLSFLHRIQLHNRLTNTAVRAAALGFSLLTARVLYLRDTGIYLFQDNLQIFSTCIMWV